MPVVGIGADLVHVPGFAEQLARPGTAFSAVFTPGERRDSERPESLAARWAAKEAFIKAWSASLHGQPPVMGEQIHHLIEVVKDAWGRPRLIFGGDLAGHLAGMETHVSLSHDGDYALAYVVLSR